MLRTTNYTTVRIVCCYQNDARVEYILGTPPYRMPLFASLSHRTISF